MCKNTQRSAHRTLNRRTRACHPPPRRLFSSIRIALTQHGTKSNSNPPTPFLRPPHGLAGEGMRLDCGAGMLIYLQGPSSGDVVIKDSISQRSVWCDRTLPLTDEVSLTSALWRLHLSQAAAAALIPDGEESGSCSSLNIPVRAGNSCSHVAPK